MRALSRKEWKEKSLGLNLPILIRSKNSRSFMAAGLTSELIGLGLVPAKALLG